MTLHNLSDLLDEIILLRAECDFHNERELEFQLNEMYCDLKSITKNGLVLIAKRRKTKALIIRIENRI